MLRLFAFRIFVLALKLAPLCVHRHKKIKIYKKHSSCATTSILRELTAINYNFFSALQSNKAFQTPLAYENKLIPGFNRWPFPSPRKRM